MSTKELIEKWIKNYVLELDLCPFAIKPFRTDTIAYEEVRVDDLSALSTIISEFIHSSRAKVSTVLIVFKELTDFSDFLDYYYGFEDMLENIEQFKSIKIVGFHPDYQHGDNEHKFLNYSNISPLPIIQLLDKDDVLIKSDIINSQEILSCNEKTLRNLGEQKLKKIIDELTR